MKLLPSALMAALALACVSCSSVYKDRYDPVELQAMLRHEVPVELNLTNDFRSHQIKRGHLALAIGRTLSENARRTAHAVFLEPGDETPPRGILTPTVINAGEIWEGATANTNAVCTVEIEWRLQDIQGNLIWLGSEIGIAQSARGRSMTPMFERTQLALDEVFTKSAMSMANSQTIATWASP